MNLSTWSNEVAKLRRRRTPLLRAPVTAVVVLALQLTALVSVSASPTGAAEKKPTKVAKDLPGLPSPAPPKTSPEIPDGSIEGTEDMAARPSDLAPRPASEKPPSFDPARSRLVDAETTATKKVYANEDRTTTVQLSSRPTRVKDAATGKWKDIDLALVAGRDGTLASKAADSGVTLAPKADGTSMNLDTPAGKISLSRPGAGPAPAVVDGSKATYKGALGGRDLVVAATADGFAESVVLHDAKAGASYVNEFTLPAGMTAREGSGGVEFVNSKGEIVATFVAGLAFDSAREPGRDSLAPVTVSIATPSPSPSPAPGPSSTTSVPPPSSTAAPASTTTSSTTATTVPAAAAKAPNVVKVEVSVPEEWLAAPERTFPVTIDPFFARWFSSDTTQFPGGDTFVLSGPYANTAYGSDPYLWGGNVLGAAVARTLVRFNLGGVGGPNVVVSNASMSIINDASADCNARWTALYGLGGPFSGGTTWNTQPPLDGAGAVAYKAYSHGAAGCYPSGEVYDVTSIAKRWMEQGAPN